MLCALISHIDIAGFEFMTQGLNFLKYASLRAEVSRHDGCSKCWPRDEDQRSGTTHCENVDCPTSSTEARLSWLVLGSQFFIAMGRLPSLDGKHTLFGKVQPRMDSRSEVSRSILSASLRQVVGQTIYNLVRLNEVEAGKA